MCIMRACAWRWRLDASVYEPCTMYVTSTTFIGLDLQSTLGNLGRFIEPLLVSPVRENRLFDGKGIGVLCRPRPSRHCHQYRPRRRLALPSAPLRTLQHPNNVKRSQFRRLTRGALDSSLQHWGRSATQRPDMSETLPVLMLWRSAACASSGRRRPASDHIRLLKEGTKIFISQKKTHLILHIIFTISIFH